MSGSSITKQDVLRAYKGARALLSDPKKWTRNTLARNAHNREVDPCDSTAVKFCAIGAIQRQGLIFDSYNDEVKLEEILGYEISMLLPTINDPLVKEGGGRRAVLAKMDDDISRLESEILAETPKPEKIQSTSQSEEVVVS